MVMSAGCDVFQVSLTDRLKSSSTLRSVGGDGGSE